MTTTDPSHATGAADAPFAPRDLEPEAPGLTLELDVRWGDMDALGHVNNIVYFQYLETARIRYYELLGMERFKERPTDGPGLVATNLNFRRQLRYPDRIRITANVTKIGRRSFTLHYAITSLTTGEVAADGTSTNVWVDYAAEQAVPLPAGLVDAIVKREHNEGLREGREPAGS